MLEAKSLEQCLNCSNCSKNSSLIKKYQELINLYRKKQAKVSFSTSHLSIIPTSSNTLEMQPIEVNCKKMVEVLAYLMKKRCSPLFRFSSPRSAKKFLVLNLCNRISKSAKLNAFSKLKLMNQKQPGTGFPLQKNYDQGRNLQQQKNFNMEFPVTQQFQIQITDHSKGAEDKCQKIVKELVEIKNSCREDQGWRKLCRKNMHLQVINKKLKVQNQYLKQALQDLIKRAAKENLKKQENIAAFAEEMSEKVEQIEELKQMLKQYQQAHPPTGNVLQSEVLSLRRELDDFKNLNKMLNTDLDQLKEQITQLNKKLKGLQQVKVTLEKQNFQLKKSNFEIGVKQKKYVNSMDEYSRLMKLMEKKVKRLNVYEKQIEQGLKNGKIISQKSQSIASIQLLKSQIILLYLANLSDRDYKIHGQTLFDEEQKNFLQNQKQMWINYQNQVKNKGNNKLSVNHQKQMFQISGIFPRDNNTVSIFEHMDMPMQPIQEDRKKQGTTIRIIQLELEIKRQIQKITQLKEQFLHIRIVILNLLKSLELQVPLKQASTDIFNVLFDIFQYSQSERDSIFVKKKKMFGYF